MLRVATYCHLWLGLSSNCSIIRVFLHKCARVINHCHQFHFRIEQGHCGACRRKWRLTDTDLCPCSETQMMSHIVESSPLTELNGGLSRLHSVTDEDVVSWLTIYSQWLAYEKERRSARIDCYHTAFRQSLQIRLNSLWIVFTSTKSY